jgi:hypothetical protein
MLDVSPPAKLRQLLRAARERGEPFDSAFAAALPVALACARAEWERKAWAYALEGTVGAWRNAYERRVLSQTEEAFVNVAEPIAA